MVSKSPSISPIYSSKSTTMEDSSSDSKILNSEDVGESLTLNISIVMVAWLLSIPSVTSIINVSITNSSFKKEDYFGLYIPEAVPNVDDNVLNPINAWFSKEEYHNEAIKLTKLFKNNFKKYGKELEYLIDSGPII